MLYYQTNWKAYQVYLHSFKKNEIKFDLMGYFFIIT